MKRCAASAASRWRSAPGGAEPRQRHAVRDGAAALALARAERLLDWADWIAATSFENLGGQLAAFDPASLALRISPGIGHVGARLRAMLADSAMLAAANGRHTQDPLSLRTIPHVHGAARDVLAVTAEVVDRGRVRDRQSDRRGHPGRAGGPFAGACGRRGHRARDGQPCGRDGAGRGDCRAAARPARQSARERAAGISRRRAARVPGS